MEKLNLESIVGFSGKVPSGLIAHPDGEYIIYALGSTILMKSTEANTQVFLRGHTNSVTCLALSNDGRYLASGQVTHQGFKADVIVWDLEKANVGEDAIVFRLKMHKVKVQAVAFSASGKNLVSLGGSDDNTIALWNLETGKVISSAAAATDSALTVACTNNNDFSFVSGGYYHLRLWNLDDETRKLNYVECNLGQLRRIIQCLNISPDDKFLYAGTATGDLFKIQLITHSGIPVFNRASELFGKGVQSVELYGDNLLVGNGDGTLALVNGKSFKTMARTKFDGSLTSVSTNGSSAFYVGTEKSNIHKVKIDMKKKVFNDELLSTCHYSGINDVAFGKDFSKVFLTCSKNDIRIWDRKNLIELLRIEKPGLECRAIALNDDGNMIVSGWSDGKIRGFAPESGKQLFEIHDAHEDVTAVAITKDSKKIVSGGSKGRVRMWDPKTGKMLASLKEHAGKVNSIAITKDDSECITAADDQCCIIWDLVRYTRNNAFFASTMFRSVIYFPDESQIMTGGSDRKLTYWDATSASAIRIVEGSRDEINALDISKDGNLFVSCGEDKRVKVWVYDEGREVFEGHGHSGGVKKVKISPDQRSLVSVDDEGGILVWSMPDSSQYATEEDYEIETK